MKLGQGEQKMHVLIVDDEPLIARTLGLIFSKSGFSAQVAHSADDALAYALETPPDLLLCDLDMPVRDGFSLMSDIGRELPACPILVLTGAYRSLGKAHDFAGTLQQRVGILTKPCKPVDVLEAASKLMQPQPLNA